MAQLVDWRADKENPFFAAALLNRFWKHFFDRGLLDPEDDLRVTNPASNPELLQTLARDFADHQFDLKHVVRTICNSQVYQFSAEPHRWNTDDKQNFSRYDPQRLAAPPHGQRQQRSHPERPDRLRLRRRRLGRRQIDHRRRSGQRPANLERRRPGGGNLRSPAARSDRFQVSTVREISERNGASRRFLIDSIGGNTGG